MGNVIYLYEEYFCYDCQNTVVITKHQVINARKKGFLGVYCTKCGKQIKQNKIKQVHSFEERRKK